MATVYNPSLGPIVIDDEGHILAADDRADLDTAAEPVAGHIAAGRLLIVEDPEPRPQAGDEDAEPPADDEKPASSGRNSRRPRP